MRIPCLKIDDVLDTVHGKLTIIELDRKDKHGTYVICKCSCGNKKSIRLDHVLKGNTVSCGCLIKNRRSPKFIDKMGKIFFNLMVLKLDKIENGKTFWLCQCKCGNITSVLNGNLVRGHTKSCGCIAKPHGMSYTRLYRIWHGIMNRCTNPNSKDYNYYKNKLCARWFNFVNFFSDLGASYGEHVKKFGEKDTSLDRFPLQSGIYEPSNVRWATSSDQNRNKITSAITENYNEHMHQQKRLQQALGNLTKRQQESNKLLELYLGCTITEFYFYIESLFESEMNWNNWGKGLGKWQYDHIKGCNNFDLSKEEDRKKCFHYTNLRPLWWKDHIKKSTKRASS